MTVMLTDNLPLIAAAPDGIKKLRALILDLAVRGKLVPQDPNDEPASELLILIAVEKARLEKAGTIRAEKPSFRIADAERPFELPPKWEWVRLGDISANIQYGFTASADHHRNDVALLRITDIQNSSVNWGAVPGCAISDSEFSSYELTNGDILIARTGGTIGKSYLVGGLTRRAVFASYLIRVARLNTGCPEYIKLFLGSGVYWKQLIESSKGTGQPNVNGTALKSLQLPLPPLAEQRRIVTRVDELMALCDRLEAQQVDADSAHATLVKTLLDTLTQSQDADDFAANWQRLAQHFDTIFTTEPSLDALKQTLLQLAVMGKLVRQDPNDESVATLNIKKATAVTAPFTIPSTWQWSELKALGRMKGGGTPSKSRSDFWEGDIPWVSPKDMKRDYIAGSQMTITEAAIKGSAVNLIEPGSILFVVRGMILAHSFPVALTKVPVTINQDMKALELSHSEMGEYVLRALKGLKSNVLEKIQRSSHGTCRLDGADYESIPIPIPPLAEQRRIAAKVDDILALCDALKARIDESRTVESQLASALIERAVAA